MSKGNDNLAQWAKTRAQSGWFLPESDLGTQQSFQPIATWVMAQDYLPSAKRDFLACSDPWLVAKASTLNAVIVTHETFDPNSKRKVKIPNVCRQFNIATIDTFELLRRLNARF